MKWKIIITLLLGIIITSSLVYSKAFTPPFCTLDSSTPTTPLPTNDPVIRYDPIIKLSGTANAHLRTINSVLPDDYRLKVYCNFLGNMFLETDVTATPMLRLSGETNAHAANAGVISYPEKLTYQLRYEDLVTSQVKKIPLECDIKTQCDTGEGEGCLLTLSSGGTSQDSNFHAASCDGTGAYPLKLCCKTASSCNGVPENGETCNDCYSDFCSEPQQCTEATPGNGDWECTAPIAPTSSSGGGGGRSRSCGNQAICESTDACGCTECQVQFPSGRIKPTLPQRNPCGDDFLGLVCTNRGSCDCVSGVSDASCGSSSIVTLVPGTKATINVEDADNVIKITKIATYKGKPVKVHVVVWE